jgi:hypothetical protein
MSLFPGELQAWASAYIEAQLQPDQINTDHSLWWAIERFQLPHSLAQAEESWSCILEVISRSPLPKVLGMLAAGPLEDLIDDWGSNFIERIEVEATSNDTFRQMLFGVWCLAQRHV